MLPSYFPGQQQELVTDENGLQKGLQPLMRDGTPERLLVCKPGAAPLLSHPPAGQSHHKSHVLSQLSYQIGISPWGPGTMGSTGEVSRYGSQHVWALQLWLCDLNGLYNPLNHSFSISKQ